MNHIPSVITLGALLCAATNATQQNRPAEHVEKPQERDVIAAHTETIRLNLTQAVRPGRREIKIAWEGQPANSILVVNLDYSVREQRRVDGGSVMSLHDAVLFRRIDATETASIVVNESKLDFDNSSAVLQVFVTSRLDVQAFENREEAKPGRTVTNWKSYTALNSPDDFQLVGNQKGSWLSHLFPDLQIAAIETTDRGYPEACVYSRSPGASLFIPLKRADGRPVGNDIELPIRE